MSQETSIRSASGDHNYFPETWGFQWPVIIYEYNRELVDNLNSFSIKEVY